MTYNDEQILEDYENGIIDYDTMFAGYWQPELDKMKEKDYKPDIEITLDISTGKYIKKENK